MIVSPLAIFTRCDMFHFSVSTRFYICIDCSANDALFELRSVLKTRGGQSISFSLHGADTVKN